jgi:hypothetical protein
MGAAMGRSVAWLARLLNLICLLVGPVAWSAGLPEYCLKAAFIYNFALFTEWPPEVGATLNLCVYGHDPFGPEIDGLQGKPVGARVIAVHGSTDGASLTSCQIVFVATSTVDDLAKLLARLRSVPVLTVADSAGAGAQGVARNMNVVNGKVTFEANLGAARGAQLKLSSKLLQLATEVRS